MSEKFSSSETSPEEQKPIDAKADFDTAKKRLEELYNPDKASILVDKSIPAEKPAETPSTARLTPEDLKEKLETEGKEKLKTAWQKEQEKRLLEAKEIPTIPVEAIVNEKEKSEATEELRQQQIENAKNELVDNLEAINKAREKKDRTAERSLLEKSEMSFEIAEGKNLKERAKEKAKIEAEKEGLRLMTKQEFLSEKRIKDTEEKVRQREWSSAILYRWSNLSDKERAKYVDENGKQRISKFATELEEKRQGLAEKGINLSRDAYYQMMKEGLQPDQMKVRGFWARIFIGPEIEVASLYWKEPLNMSKKELGNWATKAESRSIDYVKREAQRELDQKVVEGQKRWKEKKQKCTRDLIGEVVQKIETERRANEEAKKKEEAQKTSIELVTRIGKERTPEQMKEMERIRKQVEVDIKRRKESQKRIQDLIKKQKKGYLLTAREVAYLNTLSEEERKKAT